MKAPRPPRFRPALLAVASLAALAGYLNLAGNWRDARLWYSPSVFLEAGLLAAVLAVPLVVLARVIARARLVRTGQDPFARLRQWAADRPRWARAPLAAPTLLALAASFDGYFVALALGQQTLLSLPVRLFGLLGLWIGPALALGLLGRAVLRGFLVPLEGNTAAAAEGAEGFTFSAVAVTPETRAAVGGLFALTVVVLGLCLGLDTQVLWSRVGALGLGAYIALALGAPFVFQRASPIGIGLDGVLVHGSSRTRFFAYRDLDAVEATSGGEVVLRRQGRVALRLQLHGADEGRQQAIADRIREGISVAREPHGGGAARLAAAVGGAAMAGAAHGLSSFRAPGASRDELWELVEAPSTAGDARAAAAEALARGADGADRTRMRIAAEHCADPGARTVLTRVAAEPDPEEEEDGALAAAPRVKRVERR